MPPLFQGSVLYGNQINAVLSLYLQVSISKKGQLSEETGCAESSVFTPSVATTLTGENPSFRLI
jgi:hypothetical protein